MTESKKQKKLGLGGRILIGIVIGLAIGFISPSLASALSPLGTIFLRLLKMIMVPLVFFSITSGVCKMGDIKQLVSALSSISSSPRVWPLRLVSSWASSFSREKALPSFWTRRPTWRA